MKKLTQDQKENLADLLQSPAWEAVLVLCEMCVENLESQVLTADVTKSDRDLVIRKAKLDGARDLQKFIFNARNQVGHQKKER